MDLDCRITVRKYLLVPTPSKLTRKGDQLVVQSPILDITNASTTIPIRCFGDNKAYQKAQLSTAPTRINAHGTAICDSEDDFHYKRGDRFWVIVNGNPKNDEVKVQVINLDENYMTGMIPISHVCWVPNMMGPRKELWTFCGGTRERRQAGPKNSTNMTWTICQDIDGKRATTKTVSIPSKIGVGTTDRRWMSSTESRRYFSRVLMKKMENDNARSNRREHSSASGGESSRWAPSPSQADDVRLIDEIESPAGSPMSEVKEVQGPTSAGTRGFERLQHLKRKTPPSTTSQACEKRYRISVDEDDNCAFDDDDCVFDGDDCEFDDDVQLELHLLERTNPPNPMIEREFNGASPLARMLGWEEPRSTNGILNQTLGGKKLAFSASDPALIQNPTLISEIYHANKTISSPRAIDAERAWRASQCSQQLENCKFLGRWTQRHHHLDPTKCDPTKCQNIFGIEHEHCISLLASFPGPKNPCLLYQNNHLCCVWKEEDRAAMPEVLEFKYSDAKQQAAKGFTKLLDFKKEFDKLAMVNRPTWSPEALFGDDRLGECGLSFWNEIDKDGALAEQVE
ncbi:hypothetical protein ACMFMF_009275 [Clarireedia jacksonii]